jgi:hypothetical protein
MITLKNGEKVGICGNYFKDSDGRWMRMKSLDRWCSEQRMLQTWSSNKNCRGRNFDMVIDRPQEIIRNGKTWIWNLYGFKTL